MLVEELGCLWGHIGTSICVLVFQGWTPFAKQVVHALHIVLLLCTAWSPRRLLTLTDFVAFSGRFTILRAIRSGIEYLPLFQTPLLEDQRLRVSEDHLGLWRDLEMFHVAMLLLRIHGL